jgi:hypothetical protein
MTAPRGGQPKISGSNPARRDRFSLLDSVQTGSGSHPASYPISTGGSFNGPRPRCAVYHPPSCIAEVMSTWSYTYTPSYVMALAYLKDIIIVIIIYIILCVMLL